MLGTTTTLSMLFQVLMLWLLVHLKERILFLGLAVTEININFEINTMKYRNKKIKHITNVSRCRDGMPKSMQTR